MSQVEVCTVGGFSEVGRNMTAVRAGETTVVCDMGFNLQKIVGFDETNGDRRLLTREHLIKMGAIPNDDKIKSWRSSVKAILASHCHLDHIGAIPHLERNYNAPIYGTPFTVKVIKKMVENEGMQLKNPLMAVGSNAFLKVNDEVKVEFIHATHSTPHTALLAIHTKQGVVLYATDFKFDETPVVGHKTNMKALKALGQERVLGLVVDGLYSRDNRKMPSEVVARDMLKDVMLNTENKNSAIVVSCFASHIARLRSIIDFSKKLNRKVVLLGRTMMRYCDAAAESHIVKYHDEAEIIGFSGKIKKKLERIQHEGPEKYVIVCSGGQGEKNAVLSKMLRDEFKFVFHSDDQVIFSNKVIPVEPNITNREVLEKKLQKKGVRMFKDIHVSGHCAKEDIRELIKLVNPERVIPCHGHHKLVSPTVELAREMGFSKRQVCLAVNGQKVLL